MKVEFTQTQKKRPLIHIPNRPDIYIYPDSEITISGQYVTVDKHRSFYTSNLICYGMYGLIPENERTQWITDMLNGKYLTPLEINIQHDKNLAKRLPQRDITLAKYQFSNSVRPTERWIYENGKYYSVWNSEKSTYGKTPMELAWYMNRNVMVFLPKETKDCDSKLFEKLYEKQKNLIKIQ